MNGHPAYKAILDRMWELHDSKAKDYGSTGDPLANLRNGERFGMPAWKRCLVEADSAFYRLENYCNGRNPSLESAKNALMDTAAFALLSLLFLEEQEDPLFKPKAGSFVANRDIEEGELVLLNSDVTAQSILDEMCWAEESFLKGYLADQDGDGKPTQPANNPVTNPPWLADVGARMQETLEKAK